jgi:hypothetical protein
MGGGSKGKLVDFRVQAGTRVRMWRFGKSRNLLVLQLGGERREVRVVMDRGQAELVADALDVWLADEDARASV